MREVNDMSCEKCKHISESYDGKPFIPPGGSCNAKVHACFCGQKWWQYNDYYHLWRGVPNATYDAVRFGQDVVIDIGSGQILGRASEFM